MLSIYHCYKYDYDLMKKAVDDLTASVNLSLMLFEQMIDTNYYYTIKYANRAR